VAMLCSQCGKTIEKDDAQFCNHCGAPVQRQSSMAQSSKQVESPVSSSNQPVPSAAEEDQSVRGRAVEQQGQRLPLREQIAEQPGAKRQPPASAHMPAPQQMGKEHPGEERPALREQMAHIRPSSHPIPPTASTVPETPSNTGEQSTDHDLEAVHPVRPYSAQEPANLPSTPPLTGQKENEEEEEPIEERPTQLIASPPSTEQKGNKKENVPIEERPTHRIERLASAEQKYSEKEGRPVEERTTQLMAKSSISAASSRPTERRLSRRLVALVLVALVLVLAGVWVIVAQPFSVPAVTQPQVSFNNSALHISLLYPNGWLYKVSPGQSTVLFHDSSNTAQMTIVSANANGDDLATYLQSQADHVGIATPKTVSPESFAGATWQGVQGTVQQKGANYTCTIFATVQGNRLITVIQQAPQTTYNEEDSLVFSQMRASLKLT
jgi:hypothetical protein